MSVETDRELLEFAAKAAGNGANSWSDYGKCLFITCGPYPNRYVEWNPLTDDGDALRLAVKLGLHKKLAHLLRGPAYRTDDLALGEIAATRRAIVRAAAQIGRAMP